MMPGRANCLPSVRALFRKSTTTFRLRNGIQMLRREQTMGSSMGRFLSCAISGMVLAGSILASIAAGQVVASQNVVSAPPEGSGSTESAPVPSTSSIQPVEEVSDTVLDPASLLPDLPALRPSKASLIGGTIDKLDRVRDQVTVQVFGGGKMKIAFDTRTHIYNNGAPASTSDLRKGDRIYIDTILDGSTVFAKNIRLKSATSAGESQGVVISYRADRGELVVRDMLSPHPLKVRMTPQTRLVHGDHSAPASELAPGTLVAVKFGAQRDGSDVAREVSVLAVRGASFTFVGTVTAVDLRLGLLVLTSSIDHKTYEISIDPSLIPVDDMRPGSDVTVLSRFDGDRYVARTVAVNSQNQR